MSFRGIVEEGGGEHIAVIQACGQQTLRHIERMTSIGDRHCLEQPNRVRWKDPGPRRRLFRRDARGEVRDELANPMHRSARG